MRIESIAFKSNQIIPKKYTGDGEDISPELIFKDVPTGTKSLALIVEDPDAPQGIFDHWIAWNLPSKYRRLEEGQSLEHEGINSFGVKGYRGPFPPSGKPHRYYFRLYALNDQLELPEQASKQEVLKAMKGHIITQTYMIGLYQR